MPTYFAYASNMAPEGLGQRCPGAALVGPALLSNHRFVVTRDGWASVRSEASASVYGVVWQLTDDDLAALDEYEDVAADLYRQEKKQVRRLAQAKSLEAIVYVAVDQHVGWPRPGYLEAVVAAARHHGLPER
jgi:gamma-glutamylcyclotransferase (GGCT)/AIG2-like uncharacterized protein YtfP